MFKRNGGNKGDRFPSDLIVIGTPGIDVILGMNWLMKYEANVSCDKRTITLKSPSGEEVVAELRMPKSEEGVCHQISVDARRAQGTQARYAGGHARGVRVRHRGQREERQRPHRV